MKRALDEAAQPASTRAKNGDKHTLDMHGMFPPLTTPFKGTLGEGIDWDAFEKNMKKYDAVDGISGYIVGGSNSEYVSLSLEERIEVVRKTRSLTKKLIVAGCGCEGTHYTIELGNQMLDAGADGLLVITPSYFKAALNDRSLKEHFRLVAENVKGPVVLYNMPANTGVDMSHALVRDIVAQNRASGHNNIVGIKDSGGNVQKAAMIKNATPADFQLVSGSFGFMLPMLSVGAIGGVCALANTLPKECAEMIELYKAGKLQEAQALQNRLAECNFAVTAKYGSAGLKAAMEWCGFHGKRDTRMPVMRLTADEEKALRGIFEKAGVV